MALIKCPECEKEISDTIKKCPNCGFKIKKEINEKMKKKISRTVKIVIAILLIVCTILVIKENTFSADEKYAIYCTEKLKGYMKSPDSFKLHNDLLVLYDNDYNKYLYIEYTAANSYGANLKGLAIFKGYTYLGDYDDEKEDFDDNDEYLTFLKARLYLAEWNLSGDSSSNITSSKLIEPDRVGRKLKIEYNK